MNVGYTLIDRRWEKVLINSGAHGNTVTPEYIK